MRLRLGALGAVLFLALSCASPAPRSGCFEMALDDVVVGASVLETWELARRNGWACSVRPSIYAEQVGLRCADGVDDAEASKREYRFMRDRLVSATVERSLAGPHGDCAEASVGFERWAGSVLEDHRKRFGPAQETLRSDAGAETHVWSTTDEEVSLRIDPLRQTISMSATDTAGVQSLRLSEAEAAYLIDGLRGSERFGAMAEEVARNLHLIAAAESSYYSEFGRYFPAGLHPPVVPKGRHVEWRNEEAGGFRDLFEPTLGRVSCSYAVGVGPETCKPENCQSFTAVEICDPKGDGHVVHWGFVRRVHAGVTTDGPFGICRASGVYSPDSGELLGYNVVGLCEPSGVTSR